MDYTHKPSIWHYGDFMFLGLGSFMLAAALGCLFSPEGWPVAIIGSIAAGFVLFAGGHMNVAYRDRPEARCANVCYEVFDD